MRRISWCIYGVAKKLYSPAYRVSGRFRYDEEETAAATRIQAIHRGRVQRRNVAARARQIEMEEQEQERAAIRIQVRTSHRQTPHTKLVCLRVCAWVRMACLELRVLTWPWSSVQAVQRGKLGRTRSSERQQQHTAAIKIQARHRGCAQRRSASHGARRGSAGPRQSLTHC
eukprot:COSAG05_NODE_150_length_16171_cov_64.740356_7_plen_171_part_00